MKTIISFILACSIISVPGFAQKHKGDKKDKEATVQKIVEGRDFIFVANTAMPLRGMVRQLTPPNELRISGDSVISDLPYFGRAYVAPTDFSAGGIKLVSASNEYVAVPRKKSGWDISIKPLDKTNVRQFNLTIFPNGNATLQVTNTNRDPISFNGYVISRR